MSADEERVVERWRPRHNPVDWVVVIVVVFAFVAIVYCSKPDLHAGREAANLAADKRNLQLLHSWLELRKHRVPEPPTEGGHRLLLELWTRGVIGQTLENFDRFFMPGRREDDPNYLDLRARLLRGERIWTDLQSTTSRDTHYAARATGHLPTMWDAGEVIAADDNEGGWSHPSGTVNVLFADGSVHALTLPWMIEQFHWPGLDKVFPTWGQDALYPPLRKLDR